LGSIAVMFLLAARSGVYGRDVHVAPTRPHLL